MPPINFAFLISTSLLTISCHLCFNFNYPFKKCNKNFKTFLKSNDVF
jgi:hypothetical protein